MEIKTSRKQTGGKDVNNKFKVTRRTFLKVGSVVAASAICGFELKRLYAIDDDINPDPNVGDTGVKVIRTACMMCNAGCGMQVKVKDGGPRLSYQILPSLINIPVRPAPEVMPV